MNHVTESELIELYYGEGTHRIQIEHHLRACGSCTRAFESLSHDLAEINPPSMPTRDTHYGEQVWQSLRHSLPIYEKAPTGSRNALPWKAFALALACALILITVFLAGRKWERRQIQPQVAEKTNAARERIVFVVLGDHLERSERLLVELKHAEGTTGPLRVEAQDLLTTNRLYRQSAIQAGDPALAEALDHLERALLEVANQPSDASGADFSRIQKEMNTDGLLFEVRVLRSRVQSQQQEPAVGSKGVSI